MKEALKLALEALETIVDAIYINSEQEADAVYKVNDAITAIKAALAQDETSSSRGEQEPVATVESVATVVSESGNQEVTMSWWHEPALPVGTKLYTTPPASVNEAPQEQQSCDRRTWGKPWVSLTDEQKDILNFLFGLRAIDDVWFGDKHPTERGQYWWRNRLRKAFQEAAHSIKEKNT